ncbi:MAG: 4,5-dihydroxyphthalate decarboxylase [Alicyclobacillus sp.]|nr:4,5-dihydroxyphthalate decarboxylase [Alicyclobacillus sp.]
MADRTLSVAMSTSDRTAPLLSGQTVLPGYEVRPEQATIEEIFQRQLTDAPYDVAETSLASYLIALDRGEQRLTGIPVFLSRSFRHNALYVRSDSPIEHPSQLKGCRFGFPEFQMTAAVWVRGWFRDEWGLGPDDVEWVTYRPERIDVPVPAVRGKAENLFEGLIEGEVDAVMSARRPPAAYFPLDGRAGRIRRLFPDAWAEERAFYRRTGVFPIMHLVTVRKEVVAADPALPRTLYDTLAQIKDAAVANLVETIKLGATLPFAVASAEHALREMDGDIWPYGVGKNRAQLERFVAYLVEDGLLSRPISVDAAFDESVLDT